MASYLGWSQRLCWSRSKAPSSSSALGATHSQDEHQAAEEMWLEGTQHHIRAKNILP